MVLRAASVRMMESRGERVRGVRVPACQRPLVGCRRPTSVVGRSVGRSAMFDDGRRRRRRSLQVGYTVYCTLLLLPTSLGGFLEWPVRARRGFQNDPFVHLHIYLQGDHSGCAKPPVDIDLKVAF